jgi:hypothetical protein
MTEQRVVIDAQIIAAHVFSKEGTEFWKIICSELRALRAFVVNTSCAREAASLRQS